jgi:tetratricopeptide (TPR) repeat protein
MVLGVTLALGATGCPPAKPPVSAATVKDAELPAEVAKLIEYADGEIKKQEASAVENAVKALDKARAAEPNNVEVMWRLARAHAWLAEEYTDEGQRADNAQKGINAGEAAVKADPNRVESQYYLGLARAEWVSVKREKAREMLPSVVEAANAAVKLNEKYDQGGPLRLLGSVYAQAPEPPVSVGDREEGVKLLQRAVSISGGHPENHLLLGDAYRMNKDLDAAEREYESVLAMAVAGPYAHRLPKWQKQAQEGLTKVRNLRNVRRNPGGSMF